MKKLILITLLALVVFTGCTKKNDKTQIWIYTSLYKDTISDIQPKIAAAFPNVDLQFYQAGSEEVAAKVQAEALAGKIQADIMISSDRFWYEDLAAKGSLASYKPQNSDKVADVYKNPQGFYTTVSFPVMVIAYNSESVKEADVPKTFKELTDAKWKDKVSIGSPLASGTSFTTVAFLVKKYGWEYFSSLRKNNLIAEGGNSGVVRRLQSKERPIGIVLLENVLRLTSSDPRIKFVIPSDGAVIQSNVLALVKKEGSVEVAQKIADWMFGPEGQKAMARSFMYPGVAGEKAPEGAPEFSQILSSAQPWSQEFLAETMTSREQIKDQFSKTVF
ncbi:MAG: extracellular solute-binding protein [Pseudobdellovibrionaceae bacterium]